MNADIQAIKDQIYAHPASFPFFAENNFAEACYQLACVTEDIMLYLLSDEMILTQSDRIGMLQDTYRNGFRTSLKWAYQLCPPPNGSFSPKTVRGELSECYEVLQTAGKFNNIRNSFEQEELGMLTLRKVDNGHIRFDLPDSKRDINADLYARWIDHVDADDMTKKPSLKYDEATFRYVIDPLIECTWNDSSKIPTDKKAFTRVYKDCCHKVRYDAEDYSNLDFGSFTLEDFEKVYACLMALGLMNIKYQRRARFRQLGTASPLVYHDRNTLIAFLSDNTKVKRARIKAVLEVLTYDPLFHQDRFTVLQPLFAFGSYLFFSPIQLYYSDAVDKLLYVIKEKGQHEAVVSRVGKERERVMTDRLAAFIRENSSLRTVCNHVITEQGKSLAEFDMMVYDEEENRLLLVELKYFFKADGERGHRRLDRKLGEAIAARLDRQRIAEARLASLMAEAFPSEISRPLPEVASCIVSEHYAGSHMVEDAIAVYDEYLFKESLKRFDFHLTGMLACMRDGSYLPDMNELMRYEDCTEEYAGYRITYPGLCAPVP
jgi:hypothetical protein